MERGLDHASKIALPCTICERVYWHWAHTPDAPMEEMTPDMAALHRKVHARYARQLKADREVEPGVHVQTESAAELNLDTCS
jgi:acyl-CoA thioesterase FadM